MFGLRRRHTATDARPQERSRLRHLGGGVDGCSCGVALESRLGQAYNEEAFRYFLAVERTRSERSGRPFLLVLVDLKEHAGRQRAHRPHGRPPSSSRVCGGASARPTSSAGTATSALSEPCWPRSERGPGRKSPGYLVNGSVEVLGACLPSNVARRLQVRVHQHPAPPRDDSGGPELGLELIPGEI